MRNSTIREVAQLAGVSLGTVSNYLNDTKPIAEATRARIDAAIEELEFIPNTAVRVLHGHRSHVIAFVVPDGANPFFGEVARGIEDVAILQGLVLVSCNTEGDADRERHYARVLGEMRVHAAIAVASPTSEALLGALAKTGARGVIFGQSPDPSVSSVLVDDRVGGRLAMEHIVERGRRRLVVFGGPGAEVQIEQRTAGYRDALRARGIDEGSVRRIDAPGSSPSDRAEAARRILALEPRPDAVLCANDMLAIALQLEALRIGLTVPGDLAIIGYDDNESAAFAPIPLTTVRQPQREMGRRAAELALAPAGESAARIELEPELIVRAST